MLRKAQDQLHRDGDVPHQDPAPLRCDGAHHSLGGRRPVRYFPHLWPSSHYPARWLERAAQHSTGLQEQVFFQAISAGHIQLDELVTKVRRNAEKLWVWTAITAKSKLIVALHIGERAIGDACLPFHQIQLALVPSCLLVFASGGLNQYFHGLTAHFGFWDKPPRARKYHWFPDLGLQYAQLCKERYGQKVRFLYSIIRLSIREVIRGALEALELSGLVQTSFVERTNLTFRELVASLSRRTWSGAQILLLPVPEEGWLRPFPVACAFRETAKTSAGWEGTVCLFSSQASIFLDKYRSSGYFRIIPHILQHYLILEEYGILTREPLLSYNVNDCAQSFHQPCAIYPPYPLPKKLVYSTL